MDPLLPPLVGALFGVLLLGLVLRRLGQPTVLGYIAVGVLLGTSGLGIVDSPIVVARAGEVGVVLLLFFAGMEVSLPGLLSRWHVPVIGTALQIAASLGFVLIVGFVQGWPFGRSLLLGFVISLSSTAVVIKLLGDRGETEEALGRDVVSVLLAQDIAIIPMLIVIGLSAGESPDFPTVASQAMGGAATLAILWWIARGRTISLPLGAWVRSDHELQVFAACLLGLGLAFLTGLAGLSVALGAFVAGILVGAARETEWVHKALYPFQVIFLAVFFVSVGLMLDLSFIWTKLGLILLLLVAVLVTNTLVNAVIFRLLGRAWRESLYGGALLSQIGEFSFVLAAVGRQTGLIEEFAYQLTASVIALSLCVSPVWIAVARRFRRTGRTAR